ncbi:conserved exported hypothetical protein [Planktothrix serta PCC 8927]|uniref:Uncharacterized protein n=1 Tax=Planktothrix serta PCC 8927 TaxID=671068 RepID=A0A7Z9BWV5_9CYAN|nr:hypothetical protein [Planktothrix serta]VXD20411.1 conserved exported hypothetical protein [Planktothrix serta PCC 8927]
MKVAKLSGLGIACFCLAFSQPVKAEMLTLGTASGGQQIRLDTNSIQRNGNTGSWWSGFTYYLGNERIQAEAHCGRGLWTVDGEEYSPQSKATENMLSIVCSARHIREVEDMGYSVVFDPPSNVRSSPGGAVKCTLDKMTVIQVYVEPKNGWYSTQACGGGWIHESQIRAFR